MTMKRILVVDDEAAIRFAFEQFLQDEGYETLLAEDGDKALELLHDAIPPDLVFLDYRLPGMDGVQLLEEIRKRSPSLPVIFMTAFGAMEVAIKAMQLGAYEYLTKPLDLDQVRLLIRRIAAGKKAAGELPDGDKLRDSCRPPEALVGKSAAIQEVFKMIGLLSNQEVTALISGESGVGKELVARAIHEHGSRQRGPFVVVNCAAVPETLLEAELFGFEKGAFTGAEQQKPGKFELASGGTIFLDEIAELIPALQVKLLRVLQEKTFERLGGSGPLPADVRVLAATNRDLARELRSGSFRQDLFYRLHVIHIHIPPLRERREDIPLLVDHFIRKGNLEMGRRVRGISEKAMKLLTAYAWPGNVRELENLIKRAMVISREDILPEHLFEFRDTGDREGESLHEEILAEAVKRYFLIESGRKEATAAIFRGASTILEKTLICEALEQTGQNQQQAAHLLGMNRSTMRKKIRDYNILN